MVAPRFPFVTMSRKKIKRGLQYSQDMKYCGTILKLVIDIYKMEKILYA